MRLQLSVILFVVAALPAHANIITKCGASEGFSYFFKTPLTGDKYGWQKDGISKGQIQLFQSGKDYDIMYTDADGGTTSYRADGFTVIAIPQADDGFITLLLLHPTTGVFEHYLFQLDKQGNGTVIWGSVKGGNVIFPKSSLFQADCRTP